MKIEVPEELCSLIRLLAKRRLMVLGYTEQQVAANLLRKAVWEMTQDGYVQKAVETENLLRPTSTRNTRA